MSCKVIYRGESYDQDYFNYMINNGRIPEFNVVEKYVNGGVESLLYRNEELFNGKVDGNLPIEKYTKEDLKRISNDMSPAGKVLYNLMEDKIPENINVEFVNTKGYNNESGRRIYGSFFVNASSIPNIKIYQHKEGMNKEQTLLHELFHSALDGYIDSYSKFLTDGTNLLSNDQLQAMREIESLYDYYMKNKKDNAKDYNSFMPDATKIKKMKEFINDFLTNPEFTKTLNEIPLKDNLSQNNAVSWLKKLFNLVTKLFGIEDNTVASAMMGNVLVLLNTEKPQLAYSDYISKEDNPEFSEEDTEESAEDKEANKYEEQKELIRLIHEQIKKAEEFLKVDMDADGNQMNTYNEGLFRRIGNIIKIDFNQHQEEYDSILTRAEFIWKERSKDTLLKPIGYNDPISFDQYVKNERDQLQIALAKGLIIHYEFQEYMGNATEETRIKKNKLMKDYDLLIGTSFSWVKNVYEDYKLNMQYTSKTKDFSEVGIWQEDLKAAGIIDHLIAYEDGTLGINDWKTGSSFENKMISNIIMKYGDQVSMDISKQPINSAKMQVMFYAVLWKMNNPDARFKNLTVHWVNNTKHRSKYNNTSHIAVDSFLGAIESWMKDMHPEVYEKYKDTNVFNPKHYVGYSNPVSNDLADGKMSILEDLDNNILMIVNNDPRELVNIPKDKLEKLRDLTKARLELEAGGDIFSPRDDAENVSDLTIFKRWFASYEDIDNPYLNTYKKILDKSLDKARREQNRKANQLEALVKPVYEDWLRERGKTFTYKLFKNRLTVVDPYNEEGTGLYNFAWIEENEDGFKYGNVIHPEKHKEEWERRNLTENQKRLIMFLHDTVHSYFDPNNPDALMNKIVLSTGSSENPTYHTNMDLVKRKFGKRGDGKAFEYYKGMTPRYMKSQKEVKQSYGFFSKENAKSIFDRYFTFNIENTWGEWLNEEEIIPVKGIPNDFNLQSEMYSRNLEVIIDKFMRNMILKENLDNVYALGQGIRTYLEMKGKKKFKNTIDFLEDNMLMDILNQVKTTDFVTKTFKLPTYKVGTNDGEIKTGIRTISLHKILLSLKNASSASIMWLQPINGTRNGIFVGLVNSKEAIKGSILNRGIKGVDGNEVDFTASDLAFAYKQVMGMYKDSVMGNVRANKTYILAKKLDYLPDNFDWASNNNELLTTGTNLIDQGTLYMFHTIPEEAHALMIMVAQLKSMKNLATNKSMWDSYSESYDNGNGTYDVKWEGGVRGMIREGNRYVELTELDGLESRKLKRVYQRMHGNYRREERAALEAYILGQIFIQFRKYIGAMLFGSFGSRRIDQTLGYYKFSGDKTNGQDVMEWNGRLIEGRWRVLAYNIINFLKLSGNNKDTYAWKNLSTDQKGSIIDAYVTAAYMLAIYSAIAMMFDDDEEKDSFKLWMTHIAQNTGQHWDFLDQYRALRQPPATFEKPYETGRGILELSHSLFLISIGDSEGAFTRQGNLKGWARTQKGIPILSSAYSVNRFLDNTDVFGDDNGGLKYDFIRTR